MGLSARGGAAVEGGGAVLAVDAGNSKTDVLLAGVDGEILGTARGPGFRPAPARPDAAGEAVAELAGPVRAALAAAPPGVDVVHVAACLANADLPREERALGAAVAAAGWARTAEVVNDTFAVLRAGLPDDGSVRHGVAVVCGAGINCVGRAPDGRVHRFPALGRLSGDWGGGAGLAEAALWHAARAVDGRGAPTGLAQALPAHFGLAGMPELIEALHLGELPAERRYELTPVLFAVAAEGDAVAGRLVERQAEEIVAMARVALDRLGLLGTPTPVFLGGGVAAARHPALHERVLRGLAQAAPRAEATVVEVPPVLGAALLALDAADARPGAHALLRRRLGGARGR
ncbi:N-acetylglucosamine kinase [Streptomyces sp. WMMC1477]|uniref:N-acetylglucosamine kinase n=1 Tax=Streptomyces sp. WMMC1477 TaxID=3015155 RepID=UPI0022B6DE0D|nr:BadF/BadG/BcrA/BcrD ATPase family protein [Streptomyces sp. WMMC1477]MCZ7431266.1 ATPase [Streptomyces sp. WMMC1477]